VSGDLKERIDRMLLGLGDTADAVADSLRARNLSGLREDGCHCPIANLIRAEFEAAREGHGARWQPGGDTDEGDWFVCSTTINTPDGNFIPPRAIAEFITAFDNGVDREGPYQDLEEREGP
jgi:hypothetical protein